MQFIPVPQEASAWPAVSEERAVGAMAGVVACMGSPGFAQDALAHINRWLPASWWSVFRLFDHAPPCMPLSGSYRAADNTGQSWQAYRTGLYQHDQTFLAAHEHIPSAGHLLLHWHALEIPPAHREPIYTRHGLRERLSIVSRDATGALLAINLYRHENLPALTDDEIDCAGRAAGLLTACVRRHLEFASPAPAAAESVLGGLPRREREVCERLLKAWTYDGIAVDLGVSPGTVKTYRNRAFDRLGIHHRNELFALVAGIG